MELIRRINRWGEKHWIWAGVPFGLVFAVGSALTTGDAGVAAAQGIGTFTFWSLAGWARYGRRSSL